MKTQAKYFVVYLLLGLTALFIYTHETTAVPVNRPLEDIPIQVGDWTMSKQTRFNAKLLEVLRPTDYLYREYRDSEGNRVALYLGYHDGGPDSGPIHSPKNCLPGAGWFELSEVRKDVVVEGKALPLVQAVYQMDTQKELFLYGFQVKGRTVADEYSLKMAEIVNSILHNRRDSAFIRVTVPFLDDEEKAQGLAEQFMIDIYPHIASALPL